MFDVYSNATTIDADGVALTVADHGPRDGTPVLMLHGFPDSARLWRNQIPALVDAGYRVIAPDLRGFGRSYRPETVSDYSIRRMAVDQITTLDDLGVDRAHVVGHDWGSALAWYLALTKPGRVRSLTALSVGHPTAFADAGLRQREKSWYMLLFQFEGVAEEWLAGDDWAGLRRWTGNHPEADHWIEDLSRPGALTSALNIYRANMPPANFIGEPPTLFPVAVPTMGVWSTRDFALLESQMTGSGDHVAEEWSYQRVEGASHWIPLDAPDELSGMMVDWMAAH